MGGCTHYIWRGHWARQVKQYNLLKEAIEKETRVVDVTFKFLDQDKKMPPGMVQGRIFFGPQARRQQVW